jgi:glycosyltransferase involved in cell wall biosynthesis
MAGALIARHSINLGAGAALQTGIEIALTLPDVESILTFDADGQHVVQDAVAMVNAAQTSGADIVLGSRFLCAGSDMPRTRRLLLKSATLFTRATTGLPVTDAHCGLRLFSRRAASAIHLKLPGMAYASELVQIIRAQGLVMVEHPVSVRYTEYSRAKGQRNINAVNIAFDLLMRSLREPA